ncbi:MAG: type VII secretion protein EccB [Cumulibacter sp.]
MATKRDLFQSYQFSLRRVVSGLVLRETDPAQTPLRRLGGAMFGSVMVAVLAVAVSGVIGVINGGGNTTWKDAGEVFLEEETGATYAWLEDPQTREFALHPVLNYASAALLVGNPTPVSVSQASLAGAPRGPRLGIAGAPDSIPQPDSFLADPWVMCSGMTKTETGDLTPRTTLLVGQSDPGGNSIGDGSLLLADMNSDAVYLVWHGHRFLLPDPDPAITALGLRDAPQIEVGPALLDSLPVGQEIKPLATSSAGQSSSAVKQYKVGQVLVDATTKQFYLVRKDDLRNISEVEANVTLSAPGTSAAYDGKSPTALEVDNAVVTAAPREDLPPSSFDDAPRDIPTPAQVSSASSTVCASLGSNSAELDVAVDPSSEDDQYALATPQRTSNGTVLADQVLVRGGHAVYVRSAQSPTATDGALYLVTDEGVRFAVPGEQAAAALGLDQVSPVTMPATLVARIPEGPALDPVSARASG